MRLSPKLAEILHDVGRARTRVVVLKRSMRGFHARGSATEWLPDIVRAIC
jgi:hypothetical protein